MLIESGVGSGEAVTCDNLVLNDRVGIGGRRPARHREAAAGLEAEANV